MAQRPTRYSRFAYDPPVGALVEPTAGVQADGFAAGDRPPAQWINFLFNVSGGWIDYLRGPSAGNWTRRTSAGATAGAPAGDPLNRYLVLAADNTTPEREVAIVRHVEFAYVTAGPDIEVWSSTRGVTWTDVSANLPGAYIADPPRGIAVMGGHWVMWTGSQIFWTLRDTAAGVSAVVTGGPAWNIATVPGTVNAVRDLAYDAATATIALAFDNATPDARFAYSLDGGASFALWGITGAPTGKARGCAFGAGHFVVITASGEVWRATGYGANFVLASTQAASDYWQLATGANGQLVAWEYAQSPTAILVSDDDGATWTAATVPGDVTNLTRLAWVDNAWVASSLDAPYVWASNDLATWNRCVLPHPETQDPIYDVAYGEGALLALNAGAVSYQSGRAADAGPGPADGLTAPSPLADAAYLRGRVVASTAPTDGAGLAWDAAGAQWAPDGTLVGRVQTTDATVTTVASYTPADGTCVTLLVTVAARKTDGTQGAGYQRRATYRRAGGAVTLIGAVQVVGTDAEDDAGWDVTLDISGTAVRARATGAAATTIDWTAKVRPEVLAP